MKVVVAPDSFKGSLAAGAVAAALGRGVASARPDARIDLCPVADGGEGTVAAVVSATGGEVRSVRVPGPLMETVSAPLGLLPRAGRGERPLAVIEMAAASGLTLVPPDRRDPLRTTSLGTGLLILAALDAGAREIVLGIGGSATVDGGLGCAQALGARFFGRDGEELPAGISGGDLLAVTDFDLTGLDARLAEARIRIACDVRSPLLGPEGAAAVYGPQKGATPETVEVLEAGLASLSRLVRTKLGISVADRPGSGAAGGLGAGLVAFIGAGLEPGLPLVAEAVGLPERLEGADLCLTGEGRLDAQTAAGKAAAGVAKIARSLHVPVVCIPAQATADAPRDLFDAVRPLVDGKVTEAEARSHTSIHLSRMAAEVTEAFLE